LELSIRHALPGHIRRDTTLDSIFGFEPQQLKDGQISIQKRMVSILRRTEIDNADAVF
jgi:hypothetical protein